MGTPSRRETAVVLNEIETEKDAKGIVDDGRAEIPRKYAPVGNAPFVNAALHAA